MAEVGLELELGDWDIGKCSWIVDISLAYHRNIGGIELVLKDLVQIEADRADCR